MLKPPRVCVLFGRCYSHLWLMELPQVSIYFKFSSEMLSRTSSQICGRWYLPIFPFRDGLLTFICKASLMVLMKFWSSLPNREKMSRGVNMVMYRGRVLKIFLKSLFEISCWLSYIFLITIYPVTFISVYDPTFLRIGSLSLGAIRKSLMVWPPFRCTSIPYFLQVLVKLSLSPSW